MAAELDEVARANESTGRPDYRPLTNEAVIDTRDTQTGDPRRQVERLVSDHPLNKLAPVARSIVEAATRVIMRDGLKGLTLKSVAAEAGVYTDSIRYYFGSKNGLIEAVSLNVSHDLSIVLMESLVGIDDDSERTRAMANVGRRLAEDQASYRVYWELLPGIFADPEWTAREAEDYEWCRRLYAHYFPRRPAEFGELPDPERARTLTSIMVAVVDGLALQKAMDPNSVDLEVAFELFAEIVRPALEATLGSA